MRVCDVMTSNPITVLPTDSLRIAQERMKQVGCRRLPVVDAEGKVCGIITDRDVRLALNSPLVMRERWQDEVLLDRTEVYACMTPDPVCIAPDVPLEDAVEVMLSRKIGGLPVLEEQRLVGVITATDLMHALLRLLKAD
jgi:acetoin utilization protein AcuB